MLSHSPNPNLLYAEYGMRYSKSRFPLGGINRKDVFDKNTNEIIAQLQILDTLRKQYKLPSRDGDIIKENTNKLKGAFCGELSNIVRNAILTTHPEACVEIVTLEFHELILIGRKRGNPNDISTWIDEKNEGYFLDPWANEIYPVSDLPVKKTSPIIPFYSFGGPSGLTLNTVHYLSGNPRVLSCTNHYKDQDDISIKALINKKDEPKFIYAKGISAFKKQNYSQAAQEINRALIIFLQNNSSVEAATCYSTLASCYRELKQYEEAINCCSNAINLTRKQDGECSQEMIKLNEKYLAIEELYNKANKSITKNNL